MTNERTDALALLTDEQRTRLVPLLATMTIDQLGAWKRLRKVEINTIMREIRYANQLQDARIANRHLAEATARIHAAALAAGRTDLEQAQLWLVQVRDDPGRQVQARLFLGLPRIGRG